MEKNKAVLGSVLMLGTGVARMREVSLTVSRDLEEGKGQPCRPLRKAFQAAGIASIEGEFTNLLAVSFLPYNM